MNADGMIRAIQQQQISFSIAATGAEKAGDVFAVERFNGTVQEAMELVGLHFITTPELTVTTAERRNDVASTLHQQYDERRLTVRVDDEVHEESYVNQPQLCEAVVANIVRELRRRLGESIVDRITPNDR